MAKELTAAEAEKMRETLAAHDEAVAKERRDKAAETLKPARDLVDSDELATVIKMARTATQQLARFGQLASVLENIAQCGELLGGFIERAEAQVVHELTTASADKSE
jgi:hypothetical protein